MSEIPHQTPSLTRYQIDEEPQLVAGMLQVEVAWARQGEKEVEDSFCSLDAAPVSKRF